LLALAGDAGWLVRRRTRLGVGSVSSSGTDITSVSHCMRCGHM
jgi:hypothetical protein